MSVDLEEVARKIDGLSIRMEYMAKATNGNTERINRLETDLKPISTFVSNCNLGRRGALWLLGCLGTLAALVIAAWDKVFR